MNLISGKTHGGTAPGTNWPVHIHIPFSPLAAWFLPASQDPHTKRVFNLPPTTASIKTPESHAGVVSKSRLGGGGTLLTDG